MKYREYIFRSEFWHQELSEMLTAILSDMGFDAFREEEDHLCAYIDDENNNNNLLDDTFLREPLNKFRIEYSVSELPDKNWNAEWEKSYEPVLIDDFCAILAPFHEAVNVDYTIHIEPKMSFGTGHHETTRLMIKAINKIKTEKARVLDMGCGTGVLGIFALLRSAAFVTAIDIDEWAITNSYENFRVNNIAESQFEIIRGGAESIPQTKYDIILANINRNILLNDLPLYLPRLRSNGIIILSGILGSDRKTMLDFCEQSGLSLFDQNTEGDWISLSFTLPER